MTSSVRQSELSTFISDVEQKLDQVVVDGSDQQLFISSYLQGHFAVMAGQSQVQDMTKVSQLDELMQNSLQQAFSNNELEPEDQQQVWDLWQSLLA
ncbi:YfcL family protein [Paraglaciecola sp.]|uniref:YfcL family protein n=1 Tax=Paraglaciecola sp. TaxID=1920173 RepID=UPI003EF9E663